jgi:hypothetical protein
MTDSRKVRGGKGKLWRRNKRRFISGWRNILLLEGSLAVPACPSYKDRMRVNTLDVYLNNI